MKRKQGSSELRCNSINLQIARIPPRSPILCGVQKLQPFFPPIECLFKTETVERVSEFGIKFAESILSIRGITATTTSGEVAIHPKITMLLNPYKWMKGINLELPSSSEEATEVHSKLQSPNNAAYVGSILSAVLSQSKCQHFPKVFGVYTGVSEEHKIDISDDYEELCERPWFSKNVGKTFDLKLVESEGAHIQYTRTARLPLTLGEEISLDDIEELKVSNSEHTIATEFQKIFEEDGSEQSESESDVSTSYIFDIDSESEYSFEEDDEEEDDEPFAWATFKNVPVQLTIMEKLDGTFYELIKQFPDPGKHYAWMCQIVFALAYAQRNFGLTHNDLHGNNVMFKKTDQEFLYYSHNAINYSVPTYGYLMKIIDFDRGIGYVKLPGMKEPRMFISDHFDPKNEAGGQYNIQPFFSDSVQIIKPNPSFDLVRLATSMFWDLYPNGPFYDDYQNGLLFKLFIKWMTLTDGSSVLFHKANPKIDRYYGFNLYKAIARFCKDTAVPRKELSEFTSFIGQIPAGEIPLVIDI
jgi:hypothetical protein